MAEISRSLFLHAPLRRMPHLVLRQLLDRLPPDMPPTGPDGPVAVLERRLADLLGKPAALFVEQLAVVFGDLRSARQFRRSDET